AALDPDNHEVISFLGAILQQSSLLTEAVDVLRRAIALNPEDADAYNNLGNAYCVLGRWEEAQDAFRAAAALAPALKEARQNIVSTKLMRWLYDENTTPGEIFERHRAWGEQTVAELGAVAQRTLACCNSRDPARRLRVAYLSGDFAQHSVSYFFGPLLAHHDPAQIEAFCYSELDRPDAVTERLRQYRVTW